MKAVLHIYTREDENSDNTLSNNIDMFNYNDKQFVVTNIKNLNSNIFSNMEQIFYFKDKTDLLFNIKNVLKFLKDFNYTQIKICRSEKLIDTPSFENIDSVLDKLSIIDDVINI